MRIAPANSIYHLFIMDKRNISKGENQKMKNLSRRIVQTCTVLMILCLVVLAPGCSLNSKPNGAILSDRTSASQSPSSDDSVERKYPQSNEKEHRFDMGEDFLEVSIQIKEMNVFPAGTSKNPGNQDLLLVFCNISNYTKESIYPYQEWLAHTHIYCGSKEISPSAANTIDITTLTSGAGEALAAGTAKDYAIPFYLTDSLEYNSNLSIVFEDYVNSMRTSFKGGEFPAIVDLIVE